MRKETLEAQGRHGLGFTAWKHEMCAKVCGFKEEAGPRKIRRKESSGGALWAAAARQVDRFTKYRLGNKYCEEDSAIATVLKSLSRTVSTSQHGLSRYLQCAAAKASYSESLAKSGGHLRLSWPPLAMGGLMTYVIVTGA